MVTFIHKHGPILLLHLIVILVDLMSFVSSSEATQVDIAAKSSFTTI